MAGSGSDPQGLVSTFLTTSEALEHFLDDGGRLTDPQKAALFIATRELLKRMAWKKRKKKKS
ncbi:hypothetical protein W02_03810 [Nitrospira sp. KM1]|uniref:hypothetical protein n=1 Tax=Nitrospira sp. KM1 TaxID=1936990 RepID=UPI0013A75889|nr:hypothetical protein [Nitrospira sp. KM1]BCA53241.1 hypothetical protein W02_03810 [Nitrospira sp. KM1]